VVDGAQSDRPGAPDSGSETERWRKKRISVENAHFKQKCDWSPDLLSRRSLAAWKYALSFRERS
jgi:hypothetical protein